MGFNFEKLEVYQKALSFAQVIYQTTKQFPNEEIYGLTSQLRRASVSISANIAEGSSRSAKQFNNFLDIARGSVFECITLIKIASNEDYFPKELFNDIYSRSESLSMMISGLKRSLIDEQ